MTNEELRSFTFNLINTLISKQCYIKGYGKQYRVCDKDHNPVINLSSKQFLVLKMNRVIEQSGLIYVVVLLANPFKNGVDIKLPKYATEEV